MGDSETATYHPMELILAEMEAVREEVGGIAACLSAQRGLHAGQKQGSRPLKR